MPLIKSTQVDGIGLEEGTRDFSSKVTFLAFLTPTALSI